MNCVSEDVHNYLLVMKANDHVQDIYKFCLSQVKQGLKVLILTLKTYDFSHLLVELKIIKTDLKNFTVIIHEDINAISKKLMDLHDWTLLPSMVVVDVTNVLATPHKMTLQHKSILQSVTLCAATLLNYLHTITVRRKANHQSRTEENDLHSCVDGLFIVNLDGGKQMKDQELQTLKELYFYSTKSEIDMKELLEMPPSGRICKLL